jgi:peptidoglycan hydrolase-like protein with peptidoglycan-binding domain
LRVFRHLYILFGLTLIAALAITPAYAATTSKSTKKTSSKATTKKVSSKHKSSKHRSKKTAKKSWKSKGQKTITSDRTREIQQALIRAHYLEGEANGQWDSRTQAAMRKFQGDQGWQTKVLPDSRALIKLGLGPDRSDVLNPETAATSPFQPKATPASTPAPAAVPVEKTEKTTISTMAPAAAVVR